MEVSVRTSDQVILQYGQSLGEISGCAIVHLDEAAALALQQPGIKTLNPDGSITVESPPSPAPATDPREASAIEQMLAGYREMAGADDPHVVATAAYILRLSLLFAQAQGVLISAADFPGDVQVALASLPGGS